MNPLLQNAWRCSGGLARLLWPVAQFHGLLVCVRRALYRRGLLRSERFGNVVVLVVGNVVAGGAGKTPLVMALLRHLQACGITAGVVSRGYGRQDDGCLEVRPDTPVNESGDEPALIQRVTVAPVFVARKRADAVRALLAAYPATAVVVCDDGLQHYALQRDIEIAVFDDRGIGNGWLLPAGPLREPWPERLRQGVNLVLHTGQQPAFEGFTSRRQLADEAVAPDGHHIALAELRHLRLGALAGIASPEAFFSMLRARGLVLEKTLALPDHHDFSAADLGGFDGLTVLCTEKDAIKLFALPGDHGVPLLAVPLDFSPEPAFFTAMDALLAPLLSKLPSRHGHQTT
ncbi:MAG: tetraacyldisaccharide 4'-kinase [Polaromonas sp.]